MSIYKYDKHQVASKRFLSDVQTYINLAIDPLSESKNSTIKPLVQRNANAQAAFDNVIEALALAINIGVGEDVENHLLDAAESLAKELDTVQAEILEAYKTERLSPLKTSTDFREQARAYAQSLPINYN